MLIHGDCLEEMKKMPNNSVAGKVERKLRKEYGKRKNALIYGTLNNLGFMHGNKVTKKGARTALS